MDDLESILSNFIPTNNRSKVELKKVIGDLNYTLFGLYKDFESLYQSAYNEGKNNREVIYPD